MSDRSPGTPRAPWTKEAESRASMQQAITAAFIVQKQGDVGERLQSTDAVDLKTAESQSAEIVGLRVVRVNERGVAASIPSQPF